MDSGNSIGLNEVHSTVSPGCPPNSPELGPYSPVSSIPLSFYTTGEQIVTSSALKMSSEGSIDGEKFHELTPLQIPLDTTAWQANPSDPRLQKFLPHLAESDIVQVFQELYESENVFEEFDTSGSCHTLECVGFKSAEGLNPYCNIFEKLYLQAVVGTKEGSFSVAHATEFIEKTLVEGVTILDKVKALVTM